MDLKSRVSLREWQVLNLVALGKRNKEIGWNLKISENTVEQHLKKIYRKLSVSSRVEAAGLFWIDYHRQTKT